MKFSYPRIRIIRILLPYVPPLHRSRNTYIQNFRKLTFSVVFRVNDDKYQNI